jgi:hypothetical protein
MLLFHVGFLSMTIAMELPFEVCEKKYKKGQCTKVSSLMDSFAHK